MSDIFLFATVLIVLKIYSALACLGIPHRFFRDFKRRVKMLMAITITWAFFTGFMTGYAGLGSVAPVLYILYIMIAWGVVTTLAVGGFTLWIIDHVGRKANTVSAESMS